MNETREPIDARCWAEHPGRDLDLVLPGGLALSLTWLDWDSRFFGLPCYRLLAERCRVAGDAVDAAALKAVSRCFPRCAVWAKMPPATPPALIAAIQALGAEFIETELTLGHDGGRGETHQENEARIFKSGNLNVSGLLELGRSFSVTRFHTDPRIGRQAADALWTEYLKNFRLSDDRHAFLAEADGRIVGAVLAVIDRNGGRAVNVLDFVAVAPSHTGKGLGGGLMRLALSWSLSTGRPCTVATQHRNTAAIAFYQRNSFTRLVSAVPVFHLWTGEAGERP